MGNAFIPMYENLIALYTASSNSTSSTSNRLRAAGTSLTTFLLDLDAVLLTKKNFAFSTGILVRAVGPWGSD